MTSDSPSTSAPDVAGGDHLVHRRHAHEVGTERLEHADLGRGLVLRTGQAGVHALLQRRVHLAGEVAQAPGVGLGEVDEARQAEVVRRRGSR